MCPLRRRGYIGSIEPPSLSLPPLEFCLGTSPIQAEKSRPDRKAIGSATLATSAVAKAGPTPGMSSSRRLVSLDRCQALIIRDALEREPAALETNLRLVHLNREEIQ
jgi:hypothetical protein